MTAATRRRRLEPDARREQILDCAVRLFGERPYPAVSTSDIAHEAGVARGLLNHYFGTKRELYLEVVRELMQTPANPVPRQAPDRPLESIIDESVERWLTMLERNRGTWLAAIGAGGLGRDPEVEAILDEAREHAADLLLAAARRGKPGRAPKELRAAMRAYSGFAEAASVQWLEHRRLNRQQVHTLLVRGFLTIVRDVAPAVTRQ